MSATLEQQQLFQSAWLHERPRVTPAKGQGTFRVSREHALEFGYLEANVTGRLQSLVIIDRDLPDTDREPERLGLPVPTWISLNPHTTAGHIAYGLSSPVPLTDAARRRPMNLLARIEHGLTNLLDGDVAYSGMLTKNPLQHPTAWGDQLYSLRELAKSLDDLGALPRADSPQQNVNSSAVGRNVALFDRTRKWAYKAVRGHWGGAFDEWGRSVFAYAYGVNESVIGNEFTRGPMSSTEVKHIANSVANWVWKRFSLPQLIERQRTLGLRGAATRQANARAWQEQALALHALGFADTQIALEVNRATGTVRQFLATERKRARQQLKARIVAARKQGESVTAISAAENITRQAVQYHLKSAGTD